MLKVSTKSRDKTLFENKWLSLKETSDGYVYSHETRCNGHMVAVLGWRKTRENIEVLGRYEVNPSHGESVVNLTSLTGGIDEISVNIEDDAIKYAQKELLEESGIKSDITQFKSLGTVRPSKSADTTVHLFSIELKDENPVENPEGDGSDGEVGAYCKWITIEEYIACKCPLVHVMILRAGIAQA